MVLCSSAQHKYFTKFQLESNNEITEPVILIENDETININSINNKQKFLHISSWLHTSFLRKKFIVKELAHAIVESGKSEIGRAG